MKTKIILSKMARWSCLCAMALAAALPTACNDDDDDIDAPYLDIEKYSVSSKNNVTGASEIGFTVNATVGDPTLELMCYDIRSNCDWQILNDGGEDADWLLIYPREGSQDGKVRFCVKDNDATQPRAATVIFRYADGRLTERTITVQQRGNGPYMDVAVDGKESTRAAAGRAATEFKITVSTNVGFFWNKDDSDWFSISETGNGEFVLSVEAFPEDCEDLSREGTVEFRGLDSSVGAVLTVVQSVATFEDAVEITIGDLLAKYPEGGSIAENCYISGYVVSDQANGNFEPNQMIVQDASRRGLLFEFTDPSLNTYALGTKMSIWLLGKEIKANTVAEFAPKDNVYDVAAGTAEDVALEITSLENAGDYLNTLVTIKNAEWVFPYGTYWAGDEGSVFSSTAAGASSDHARMVRAAEGGAIRAYMMGGTSIDSGIKFKHARLLPKGKGDLTGIIMNRKDDYEGTTLMPVLRMRNLDDDAIAESGDRGWTTLVEFVWPPFDMSGTVPIVPITGSGTLKSSFETQWFFGDDSRSKTIYAGYCYWRTDPATQAASGKTYVGMNAATWMEHPNSIWKSGGYPEPDVVKGEAWIATVSTADVSDSEEVAVAFSTSSSATGPRDFIVEWSDSETGTFHPVSTYSCTNWSALLYAPEFHFTLPAECNGLQTLVIRLRVNGTRRANLAATDTAFASGGTNRLCAFSVAKHKK